MTSPGTRFGPYEIVELLGAGGMGAVYRAKDGELGREVAIKLLPASLVDDAERLARFEREAKTLASLNHHNVAQIYGIERTPAGTALVLELVEGPTLADRMRMELCRSKKRARSPARSRLRSRPRTSAAWFIGISSPRTSSAWEKDSARRVHDIGTCGSRSRAHTAGR
jgi:serine/threonine protein kinase